MEDVIADLFHHRWWIREAEDSMVWYEEFQSERLSQIQEREAREI